MTGNAWRAETAPRRLALRGGVRPNPSRPGVRSGPKASVIPAVLALIGSVVPSDVQFYLAGAKFTVGRTGIILLLLPALALLLQGGRRLLWSDFFVLATASWIVGAAVYTDGTNSLSSAGAEAVEIFGGYVVGRAFFFGPAGLANFIRVLKAFVVVTVVLAMADNLSGHLIVRDTVSSLMQAPPPGAQYRQGMVRAMATFDHAILFGAFCTFVGAILLYSEQRPMRRALYVGLCLLGCILSLSSASIMAFVIILAAYSYDQLMKPYPWRWSLIWIGIAAFVLAVFLVANHPLGWLISNLTLEPASGYFRMLIWDAAISQMALSPLTGFAFASYDNFFLDATVDSVWLVFALRFGIPAIAFLFLANVMALLPTNRNLRRPSRDTYIDEVRRGFSLVLVMFMFVGLTVHYWNFVWIFWGLCIGVRASLREQAMQSAVQPARLSRSQPVRAMSR